MGPTNPGCGSDDGAAHKNITIQELKDMGFTIATSIILTSSCPGALLLPLVDSTRSFGQFFFILLATLAAGRVGFYFKVYTPKKQRAAETDGSDDFEYNEALEDDFDESDTVVPLDDTDEEFKYEE